MLYSTLKEVYNIDSFEKKKKKKDDYKEEDFEEHKKHITQVSQLSQTSPPMSPRSITPSVYKQNIQQPQETHTYEPYYDKELEQYLAISNTKYINEESPPKLNLENKEENKEDNNNVVKEYIKPLINESKEIYYKNLVNIGLFVFIGILIIFLCDQITEIAINIGMKKTVLLLEPFLSREKNKI